MDRFATPLDTQVFEELGGIRQRQTRNVRLNTPSHRRFGCPLALHKIQIYPVSMTAEVGDFCHESARNSEP